MGCGTSKSDGVIPANTENAGKNKKKSTKQNKKSTNGSSHQKENKHPKEIPTRREAEQADLLPGAVPENESELMPPPVSFEISAQPTEEDSIIKKHPPKRLQVDNFKGLKKMEEHTNGITNRQIIEKQMSAKERRSQHLQERVQSSRLSRRNVSRSAMPASKLEPTIPETSAI